MAAGPCRNRDQPVSALLDRLVGEAVVDHIMHGDPAPIAHRIENFGPGTQRGDDQGHLPFLASGQILHHPVVGLVDNLVDRERGCGAIRVCPIVGGQFLGDLVQPFIQQRLRARVQCREAADDPRLALRNHQFRAGDNEQRRSDQRQTQAIERGGKGHRFLLKTYSASTRVSSGGSEAAKLDLSQDLHGISAANAPARRTARQCLRKARLSRPRWPSG